VKIIDEQIGDGADRRKRRFELLRRYVEQAGTIGRSTNQMYRFTIGNLGLTRKTSESFIRDAVFIGIFRWDKKGRAVAL